MPLALSKYLRYLSRYYRESLVNLYIISRLLLSIRDGRRTCLDYYPDIYLTLIMLS